MHCESESLWQRTLWMVDPSCAGCTVLQMWHPLRWRTLWPDSVLLVWYFVPLLIQLNSIQSREVVSGVEETSQPWATWNPGSHPWLITHCLVPLSKLSSHCSCFFVAVVTACVVKMPWRRTKAMVQYKRLCLGLHRAAMVSWYHGQSREWGGHILNHEHEAETVNGVG